MSVKAVASRTNSGEKAIFNLDSVYLHIGEKMDLITSGLDMSRLDPAGGKSPVDLRSLAFVSIFQYAEGLSDLEASEALRTRMDWKYALRLPFGLPGLAPEELCNFRRHLWVHPESSRIFNILVERVAGYGLFGARPIVNEITCDLLSKSCFTSRVVQIEAVFARALGALAAWNPDWLKDNVLPHWYARYSSPNKVAMLTNFGDKEKYVLDLGLDARKLLQKVQASTAPDLLALHEIEDLEKTLEKHFRIEGEEMYWRTACKDGEEYAIKLLNCQSAAKNL